MAYKKDVISIRNGDILEITKSKRLPNASVKPLNLFMGI